MSNDARIHKELELAAALIQGVDEAYRHWLVSAATDVWRNEVEHASGKINVNQRLNQALEEVPGGADGDAEVSG